MYFFLLWRLCYSGDFLSILKTFNKVATDIPYISPTHPDTSINTISSVKHRLDGEWLPVSASNDLYTDRIHLAWDVVIKVTSYGVWRSTTNFPGSAMLITTMGSSPYEGTMVTPERIHYQLDDRDLLDLFAHCYRVG
jgi:hypothetical protein